MAFNICLIHKKKTDKISIKKKKNYGMKSYNTNWQWEKQRYSNKNNENLMEKKIETLT